MMKRSAGLLTTAAVMVILPGATASAQSLAVTYGSKGVQTLSYGATRLVDVGANPGDAFHVWHLKSTDLNGNIVSSGQYGWGESNNGETWDATNQTETYSFSWGTITTHFVQNGNNLDMVVTETNNPGSGIILDGAEIYPFTLHFPQDPAGFSGYSQYAITTLGPGVSAADFGSGVVTAVIPNEAIAIYGGWKVAGGNAYTPVMTTTAPDFLATFLPRNDVPVAPGSTLSYTVSLRFTPSGTAANATDAYASFSATYPSLMTWTDKRAIGTAYLASSPSGADITQSGGYPTNPRRFFNDPSVDITTASGIAAFQSRMLAQATANAANSAALNAQGVITWDIEGEQFPQTTSYVCSPDQIATVAPEMEGVVSDSRSPYRGQKLDDAYFKIMRDAGLKIGLCLRPQVFALTASGTASQSYLASNAAIVSNLENKARYANSRWGATIFYVDSTVDVNGGTLDPAIFQQLITDLPSFLFIPEESTPRYYAYSAPFYSFIFHTTTGTPASTYLFYPKAFGATLVNDVDAATLATYTPQLTQSVRLGDILMGHVDYWQANNPTLKAIYDAAGVGSTAPLLVTPAISWSAPADITYGTALSSAQLNAVASTAGAFKYVPTTGTILGAGNQTLLATFTPSDTRDYTSATGSVMLKVNPFTPSIAWATPTAIVAGTTLSSTQLNATSNVPGTFTYSPPAGTILKAGNTTLNVSFAPLDAVDYLPASSSVIVSVTPINQVTPTVSWANPASIMYGTILGKAQLNATASVPGAFAYTPAAGAVLNSGINVLHVTFTPSDGTTYTSASSATTIVVTKASPVLSWPTPLPIPYGTSLGASQLNASANVPGTFTYAPAAGAVLSAGINTLRVTFTPQDTLNYVPASASTAVKVTKATPALTWAAPSPITTGTALSSAQLNATAGIPGKFTYTPALGALLPIGAQTLAVSFTPADAVNYNTASASVLLTVNGPAQTGPVYITSPTTGAVLSGTVLVSAVCNLPLDSAGSFLMVDGVEVGTQRVTGGPFTYVLNTALYSSGTHVLQIWAHDIGDRTTISPPIAVSFSN